MHIETKSFLEFNYNNDNIKDYVVNYTLENCVQGNGWTTDFIIFTSNNNKLEINQVLTKKIKQNFLKYVIQNYKILHFDFWLKSLLNLINLESKIKELILEFE